MLLLGFQLKVSTFPNAAVTCADVPVIFMLFVTVIVPVVEVAIVVISVAAIWLRWHQLELRFLYKLLRNVPANAAAKSDVDPVRATL